MVQCKKRKINYKLKKVIDTPKDDWIITQNTHEPIIEKDKFYSAQNILKSKEKTRNKSVDLLLRGLVICKECGKKMGTTTDIRSSNKKVSSTDTRGKLSKSTTDTKAEITTGTRYLRCSSYATAPRQRICTPHLINYQKLEDFVISSLKEECQKYLDENSFYKNDDIKNQELDKEIQIKKEKTILSKAIDVLETQIDRIYDDKLSGLISNSDFSRIYDKKISERDEKKKKLKDLEDLDLTSSHTDYEKIISDFLKSSDISSFTLTSLIKKIEIDERKKITLTYAFGPTNIMS